tara:strand:- start:550 stop:1299 length:750 start_codon:yes stop_codon:yes gene_type:complete
MQTLEFNPYSVVAPEYYDDDVHPTCASFREASFLVLEAYLSRKSLIGQVVCDLGGGKSIIAEHFSKLKMRPLKIDIRDVSEEMLRHSQHFARNDVHLMKQDARDLAQSNTRYDVIAAFLADPFNNVEAWRAVHTSLQSNGELLFVTPSWEWSSTFRNCAPDEKEDSARFLLKNGGEVFVPSIVLPEKQQVSMFENVGFKLLEMFHVPLATLRLVAPKLTALDQQSPVVTGYRLLKDSNLGFSPRERRVG